MVYFDDGTLSKTTPPLHCAHTPCLLHTVMVVVTSHPEPKLRSGLSLRAGLIGGPSLPVHMRKGPSDYCFSCYVFDSVNSSFDLSEVTPWRRSKALKQMCV
ncbi:hypothetical protein Plhal304r1_c026g0088101 [Plasmopara halstedii]